MGGREHSLGVQEQRRKSGPLDRTIVLSVIDRVGCVFGSTATFLDRWARKSSDRRGERNGVGTNGSSDFDEGLKPCFV